VLSPREDLATADGATFGRARADVVPDVLAPARRSWRPTLVQPALPIIARTLSTESTHPVIKRWSAWCRIFEVWHARQAPAPDLAEDIGSAGWLRGALTLIVLIMLALAFWPSFSPVEAAALTRLDETARAEFRAQSLTPFVAGATHGRHFAAGQSVLRLAAAPERATIQLTATIGEEDSLPRMLQRAGLGGGDAVQVGAMVASVLPLADIAAGTRFEITLGQRAAISDPRPLVALHVRPRFDLALTIERRGPALILERQPIAVDSSPLRIRGLVGASLYRSARAAGAPAGAVQDYLRTVDAYLPFEDISPTDEFDLVVSYKRTADGQGEAGNLLYAGVLRDGKSQLQLLRWGQDGNFFTPGAMNGASQQDSSMLGSPVAGRITSGFGMRRHPILGYVRKHSGIDFAASWGSPIYAVNDGVVNYAGWHGGHGNYVRLDHSAGISSGYGHMSRMAVSSGMMVRRGQVIGYVGSTGLSTGPHLHYELYRGGLTVDPMSVRMIVRRQTVDSGQLAAFKARLQQMLSLRAGLPR
jgi:murein DD-endopeptidase MepM/ murein hydrolase activator NlpD